MGECGEGDVGRDIGMRGMGIRPLGMFWGMRLGELTLDGTSWWAGEGVRRGREWEMELGEPLSMRREGRLTWGGRLMWDGWEEGWGALRDSWT